MLPRPKSSRWERLVASAALSLIESKRKSLYATLFILSWLFMVTPLMAVAVMMFVHPLVSSSFALLLTIFTYLYMAGMGLLMVYQAWVLSKDPNFIELLKQNKKN